MRQSYFLRVISQSPTEFWINNPTREHADLAIAHGASGCTNNPSYTQKMVDHPNEGAREGPGTSQEKTGEAENVGARQR